jgi:DNA-binding transcriptional MerR regulator
MADGMTIEELAQVVGMTPRNIRAHQSKGLLFSPEIRDRVARYNGGHAARLALIASLQREGFTLTAIKRLLDEPESYSSVIADRRRGIREATSDLPASVPITQETLDVAGARCHEVLVAHGLVWDEADGPHTHTVLAAVSRTLSDAGVPLRVLIELLTDVAECAERTGTELWERTAAAEDDGMPLEEQRREDLVKLAAQLYSAGFELAFARAAARSPSPGALRR